MSRPQVGLGVSCPPHKPGCTHPAQAPDLDAVQGYNDDRLITGSVGAAPNAVRTSTVEAGQTPEDEQVEGAQPLPNTTEPNEAERSANAEALALSPALRLRSLPETPSDQEPVDIAPQEPTEAMPEQVPGDPSAQVRGRFDALADAEPLDLNAQPDAVLPMADSDELDLRASTSPIDLDPPIVDASLSAPAATSVGGATAAAEIAGGGADTASAETEVAALETPALQVETAPRFSGEVSVQGSIGTGPRMTLPEVVSRAATMHPEVTLALAQVDEARAGVMRARSGLGPQVDIRLAAGQEASAGISPTVTDVDARNDEASMRVDGSIRLRQMLYDFNATRDEVLSTVAASDAARLRTIDVTEDISLRTSRAYLDILRQRQLLALIDRNIAEHERLLQIVRLNEADGNSTMADVNRVEARLSEVRSARTDLAANLDAAQDQFQRLARIEPGRLVPPDPIISRLAPNADQAIERALGRNPSLLSQAYNLRALQHELDVVNGDGSARVDLEVEANSRNYFSGGSRSDNDVRGMVVFSYSLFDAGDAEGEQRQVEARIRQTRARYTARRDQVEADIRQAYRAIASARRKLGDLREGLASSREVQALYTEQFQAGERTIFELLDAQTALFTAEQQLISNQFSELDAAYAVLRATGDLTATLLHAY
ncbi:MAG: TolC family protein [Pseudomonadota bacterium]